MSHFYRDLDCLDKFCDDLKNQVPNEHYHFATKI